MPFELAPLPFDRSALEPWTSAGTFDFHYDKHHAGYVKKLNAAIEGSEWEGKELMEVISGNTSNPAIYNSAAQHFNHSFFWNCLTGEKNEPSAEFMGMLERDFGSFEAFKEQFSEKALKLFGSGWAWLVKNGEKLEIAQYKDAETPAGTEMLPLLTLDVWEHAYYIDYRNDRASFIEGFWNHVNWEFVEKQLS